MHLAFVPGRTERGGCHIIVVAVFNYSKAASHMHTCTCAVTVAKQQILSKMTYCNIIVIKRNVQQPGQTEYKRHV